MRVSIPRTFVSTLLLFAAVGCSDSVADPDLSDGPGAPVAVAVVAEATPRSFFAPQAPRLEGGALLVSGFDGSLEITGVQVVLAEIEAEREGVECEGSVSDCPEFLDRSTVLDLPLSQEAVSLGIGRLPEGRYEEIEVEVEGWDDDDELPVDATGLPVVGWPEDAALRVEGRFLPTEGDPRPFVAYLAMELEAELEFEPELQLGPEGAAIELIITPAAWFLDDEGYVLDLSSIGSGAEVEEDRAESGFEIRIVPSGG